MDFISFGRIDKKLFLIIFITIVRTINLIVSNEVPDEYSNGIFCSLEEEIGSIIVGIILILIFKNKQKEVKENKKSIKYLAILLLLRAVKSSYERYFPYFVKDKKYKFNNILNTINGIEIILMTVGTFLLLKYKYYIHHYISMLIYCFLGIASDFILENYSIMNYKYIYIYTIYILNEVILFCYLKYMMDKLYYHYTEVLFYWGIVGLIVKLIIFSSLSIYEYKNDIDGILYGIKKYFEETNVVIIIFLQFFYYLLDGGIYYLLITLMLYYLKPNHMIITDELHVYEGLIFYKERPNKYYSLFPFVFQILALLFYFEILEFNFCNLNINTIKNIQDRERKESEVRNSVHSTDMELIDFNDEYFLNGYDSKNNDVGFNVSKNDAINNNNVQMNVDKNNNLLNDFVIINNNLNKK